MPAALDGLELLACLDTLGDRSRLEPAHHPRERVQDDLAVAVVPGAADQVAVQLVDVGAHVEHHLVVRLAEAHVVEGDRDPASRSAPSAPRKLGRREAANARRFRRSASPRRSRRRGRARAGRSGKPASRPRVDAWTFIDSSVVSGSSGASSSTAATQARSTTASARLRRTYSKRTAGRSALVLLGPRMRRFDGVQLRGAVADVEDGLEHDGQAARLEDGVEQCRLGWHEARFCTGRATARAPLDARDMLQRLWNSGYDCRVGAELRRVVREPDEPVPESGREPESP